MTRSSVKRTSRPLHPRTEGPNLRCRNIAIEEGEQRLHIPGRQAQRKGTHGFRLLTWSGIFSGGFSEISRSLPSSYAIKIR